MKRSTLIMVLASRNATLCWRCSPVVGVDRRDERTWALVGCTIVKEVKDLGVILGVNEENETSGGLRSAQIMYTPMASSQEDGIKQEADYIVSHVYNCINQRGIHTTRAELKVRNIAWQYFSNVIRKMI
ncbi:hypothetical protein Scep_023529 [Stephania cephalantha]|uniref:Uncharacterized protein n=1 Tax=Stephania cephalantha TaxID=152367 RepID=A0AAP0EVD1_9MAGN